MTPGITRGEMIGLLRDRKAEIEARFTTLERELQEADVNYAISFDHAERELWDAICEDLIVERSYLVQANIDVQNDILRVQEKGDVLR